MNGKFWSNYELINLGKLETFLRTVNEVGEITENRLEGIIQTLNYFIKHQFWTEMHTIHWKSRAVKIVLNSSVEETMVRGEREEDAKAGENALKTRR